MGPDEPRQIRVLDDEEDIEEGREAPPAENIAAAAEAVSRDLAAGAAGARDFAPEAAGSFDHLDPQKVVPPKLLAEALAFLRAHESMFPNRTHISILDYSRRSTEPRFHVIDMRTGAVQSFRMSNGRGSEPVHDGFARHFGNKPGSNMSSLGFARTAETYQGKHGLSLRLDGLSESNSNLRRRAVVVHGATYVRDEPVVQGRSEGCPAVPMAQKDRVIGMIKGGSLMYAGLGK